MFQWEKVSHPRWVTINKVGNYYKMTPEQFCYWLQGRAELQPTNPPSPEEWKMIAEHLQFVFKKETPVRQAAVPSPLDALAIANERLKRERLQQQNPFSGGGLPQCGTVPDLQFGRNSASIC